MPMCPVESWGWIKNHNNERIKINLNYVSKAYSLRPSSCPIMRYVVYLERTECSVLWRARNEYGEAAKFIFEVLIWLDFNGFFIIHRGAPRFSGFLEFSLILYFTIFVIVFLGFFLLCFTLGIQHVYLGGFFFFFNELFFLISKKILLKEIGLEY